MDMDLILRKGRMDEQDLRRHFAEAVSCSNESPVLLTASDDATEVGRGCHLRRR